MAVLPMRAKRVTNKTLKLTRLAATKALVRADLVAALTSRFGKYLKPAEVSKALNLPARLPAQTVALREDSAKKNLKN